MSISRLIRRAYDFFENKRRLLYTATFLFSALCLTAFFNSTIRSDIRAMLPEGNNGILARDFDMLGKSSLSNNVFVTLHATNGTPRKNLLIAAATLSDSLQPPHFILVDPASVNPLKIMNFLLDNAANLVNENDMARIRSSVEPKNIRTSLEKDLRMLTSPQGMVMKSLTRRDPLEWRNILAPRLKNLNQLTEANVKDGYLFSKDGRAILLTFRSDIPLTDVNGSKKLVKTLHSATAELPKGVTASIISGHIHTLANANTIKSDLTTISLVSLTALVLLFIIFFRSSQAFGVFLAPAVAMCTALGALTLSSESISAIVIGFGAVLIGISIDFAMHVYFAIARYGGSPGKAASSVARPILYCALTSCAAFGALFLSGIPGIRQLALFSIAGLIASAFFSLLVLPHLSRIARIVKTKPNPHTTQSRPHTALAIWTVAMAICLLLGASISIDPNLHNIGYVPDSVRLAEQDFNKTWGNLRNRAVIFAESDTMETALAKNEHVARALMQNLPDTKIVSLASILFSETSQIQNRQRWAKFWTPRTMQATTATIQDRGHKLGFSHKAFLPFIKSLATTPTPITPESLNNASMGIIKDMFIPDSLPGTTTLVTFLPDSEAVQSYFSPEVEKDLGVRLISGARFKTALETAMNSDIRHFITIAGLVVVVLALALFRDVRRAGLSLIPAATGVATVFGVLGLTHTDLNLFHITALPLIIGLGADYGIFLASRENQSLELNTMAAVKVSGLTTLAGFGTLVLARHPSLHSLGITVLVGIGAALFCALFIMPHLLRRQP